MAFFDEQLETLSRSELAGLQSEKLVRLVRGLESIPFYRRKLEAAGVSAATFGGIDDLARLPFTHKRELVEAQQEAPPYGDLLGAPREEYRYLHQTSGTSGKPLVWLDTEEDWQTWVRCWGHVYRGAGVTSADTVFCAFSFGPYVAHWSSLAGARSIGAMGVPGAGLSSLQRLERLLEHGATVLVSTPTYALHLAEVAREHGLDLAGSRIRRTIHAGEPGANVPSVKRRIAKAWGAEVFDHAGATEVGAWGFGCEGDGAALHLNEIEFLFEVVDPDGVPAAAGDRGELVITTLGRAGMPVLRYRTGDLVVRTDDPCSCGRTLSRARGGVIGRADDMMVVRGVNVYPSAVDNLLRKVAAVEEYEVEIRRRGELDELTIRVEVPAAVAFDAVERKLAELFRTELGIRVAFDRAEPGSLPRYELKAARYKRVES